MTEVIGDWSVSAADVAAAMGLGVGDASAGGLSGLALELADTTTTLRRATRRAVRQRVHQPALPAAEVEVLVAVVESPGERVTEIAKMLSLAPNTVSTLVGRLVSAGLLERSEDPDDRRAAVLRATPAGRARVRRWRRERTDLVSHALAALEPDDRMAIRMAIGPLRNLAIVLHERSGGEA